MNHTGIAMQYGLAIDRNGLIEEVMGFHFYEYVKQIYLRVGHQFPFILKKKTPKLRINHEFKFQNKSNFSKNSFCFLGLFIFLHNIWMKTFLERAANF